MQELSGVAIVLLNYNGAKDTLACVDSLLDSDLLFSRLIICDNRSPDGSFETLKAGLCARSARMAEARARAGLQDDIELIDVRADDRTSQSTRRSFGAWVTLVDNGSNKGFAAGCNAGLVLAFNDPSIEWFWLLNNDTIVAPDCLSNFLRAARSRPAVDLWGNTVIYHDNPTQVQALGGGTLNSRTAATRHIGAWHPADEVHDHPAFVDDVEKQMDYALGASMFASRRWLEQVGLLNEAYFLYYEELDWSTRGKRIGLVMGYAPAARIFHKEGASIGTAPSGGSATSVLHLARSRVLFARQHMRKQYMLYVFAGIHWQAMKFFIKTRVNLATASLRGLYGGLTAKLPSKGTKSLDPMS